MTVRMTISMTEEHAARIEALVKSGEYASASEVLRDGLRALDVRAEDAARQREEHEARMSAIRADLKARAEGEFVTMEEANTQFKAYMARRAELRKHAS